MQVDTKTNKILHFKKQKFLLRDTKSFTEKLFYHYHLMAVVYSL